tara:strand:- start:453 stop:608 length:156 start_codon:yes stop_codon:yes gene_type:complete
MPKIGESKLFTLSKLRIEKLKGHELPLFIKIFENLEFFRLARNAPLKNMEI